MRFAQLSGGSGDTFYCENCLRDAALVRALRRAGHEAVTVPLYLPLMTGEGDQGGVFFGGINVFLQQHSAVFRHSPRWLDRLLDSPRLLRWAGRKADMTSARGVGETLLSMLRGEEGRQAKELGRLVDWLAREIRPQVVSLTASLLAGVTRRIKRDLGAVVICTLQDEEGYLDSLEEPYRAEAWHMLRRLAADIDAFIAPSRFYAERMRHRLDLPDDKLHVIPNGIDPHGYAPAERPGEPPVVGYLAQLSPAKGLDTLAEAFLLLRKDPRLAAARLRAFGGVMSGERAFVDDVRRWLAEAGAGRDAELLTDFSHEDKSAFLRSCSVVSVPTKRGEAFGLFVLEALASGTPVVLPDHGAFGELVADTGGGLLCPPNDPAALAETLRRVLLDRHLAERLGRAGRQAVLEKYTTDIMAAHVAALCDKLLGTKPDEKC